MNWTCSLCGGREWPKEGDSCPLCRLEREEPEGHAKARESAIGRFTQEGCREYSASHWWDLIDQQTNEDSGPDAMAERLDAMHEEICREAWQDGERPPSSLAWADACALAGFDLCKNYRKKEKR
jgi:hypothetical protein